MAVAEQLPPSYSQRIGARESVREHADPLRARARQGAAGKCYGNITGET